MADAGQVLHGTARATERLRFVFLPLALCALCAVGAHAAADALSERIFGAVDAITAALDAFFSRWELTAPLVDLVSVQLRTQLSRGAALLFELVADALLAAPLLGYAEREDEVARALPHLRKWLSRPSLLRISRPLFTAAVTLAGACTVARLAHGSVYASAHGLFGTALADWLARGAGLLALCLVLALIAWRAVVHSLSREDARADRKARTKARALRVGLVGSLLLAPIAWMAVVHASPLLSFLR